MTAPSSERTAPPFERRDQLSHVRHFVPLSAASRLKCSRLARQYQAACRAHLGLPLAPAFNTSEERGKCFCAGSRYSWCAAWWLSWGGPRPARSLKRLSASSPSEQSKNKFAPGTHRGPGKTGQGGTGSGASPGPGSGSGMGSAGSGHSGTGGQSHSGGRAGTNNSGSTGTTGR